ncbi:MAG: hypothetical protein ACYSU0_18940 [Planctomycetota bacterium]|jgi:hypothetical protein
MTMTGQRIPPLLGLLALLNVSCVPPRPPTRDRDTDVSQYDYVQCKEESATLSLQIDVVVQGIRPRRDVFHFRRRANDLDFDMIAVSHVRHGDGHHSSHSLRTSVKAISETGLTYRVYCRYYRDGKKGRVEKEFRIPWDSQFQTTSGSVSVTAQWIRREPNPADGSAADGDSEGREE